MGCTILKNVIIEKDGFQLDAEICSWETCLWRIKVIGQVWIGAKSIKYEYEAINRSIRINDISRIESDITREHEEVLRALSDLAIIRAIDPGYYPDALTDADLKLELLEYIS